MAITRAKATSLLNKTEMGLYDDSRRNAARQLDERGLGKRIERTRKARDRARDLVQRQKLALRRRTDGRRAATGTDNRRSRDKAELLDDILKRFEAQLKRTKQAVAAPARAGKAAAKQAAGRKAAVRKAPAKKTAAKTQAVPKRAASKAGAGQAAGKAAEKKPVARAPKQATGQRAAKAATAKKRAGKRGITPEQALANTRALLEAKQEQARQPKPWQPPAGQDEPVPEAGFQSSGAARSAGDLHAGESRLPAIQGSIGTRGRLNQGKRDHRRSPGSED